MAEKKPDTPAEKKPDTPAEKKPRGRTPGLQTPGADDVALSAADEARLTELAQSGYSLPRTWFAGHAGQAAREAAIAEKLPRARPEE